MKKIQHFLVALLLLSGVHSSTLAQHSSTTPEPRPIWRPTTTPTRTPLEQRFRLFPPLATQPLPTPQSERFPTLKRPPTPPESAIDKIKRQVGRWWADVKTRWERKLNRYLEHPGELAGERPFSDLIQAGLQAFFDDVLKPVLKSIWLLLLYPLWQGIKRVFSKDA